MLAAISESRLNGDFYTSQRDLSRNCFELEPDTLDMTASLLRTYLTEIVGEKYRYPDNELAAAKIAEVEDYMENHFELHGWEIRKQQVSYDRFTSIWGHSFDDLKGYNMIATKAGRLSRTLIIAAHHDTVVGSPGADDNGSGVVLLLYLAQALASTELDITIMLVSFDFEELGLAGSQYFVKHIEDILNPDDLIGVFVLEMLGYYTRAEQKLPQGFDKLYYTRIRPHKTGGKLLGDFYAVIYNGRSKAITKHLEQSSQLKLASVRDPGDLPLLGRLIKKLVPSVTTMLRSDHTSFWLAGLPAVMVTDTADFRNPNYHRKSDKVSTIDFERLGKVAVSLERMIRTWSS